MNSVFPLFNYYSSRLVISTYTSFPHYKQPTKSLNKRARGNTSLPCKLYYITAQIDKIDCHKCFFCISYKRTYIKLFRIPIENKHKSNHCLLLVFQYRRGNGFLTLIHILHCVASIFDWTSNGIFIRSVYLMFTILNFLCT